MDGVEFCSICTERSFADVPRVTLTCGHSFCFQCIYEWKRKRDDATCPHCRAAILVELGEQSEKEERVPPPAPLPRMHGFRRRPRHNSLRRVLVQQQEQKEEIFYQAVWFMLLVMVGVLSIVSIIKVGQIEQKIKI